jgi:plasmid stabilization system protein ParE
MNRPLVIRRLAERDLKQATRWYDKQRQGLGDDLMDEVVETIDKILDRPLSFPVVYRDIRRALLDRFPYGVYFRMRGDTIVITAVHHGSRDPSRWQNRS